MKATIAFVVLAACAHNVPQDRATSADGKLAGAKPLVLDGGAVTEFGIVTYPGGDRVDWKKVVLPDKLIGPLNMRMTWTSPRPGLKLAFDVFDAWNAQVASSKKGGKYNRLATIENAHGTYFIRVYAVGRGDAGRYKLGVEFDGREVQVTKPPEVADPPKLPDVPAVTQSVPCDLYKFDFSNPECHDKCPAVNPQSTWPGCSKTCTVNPPDAAIPACAKEMACPPGGDIRVRSCERKDFRPCPDPRKPDPTNRNCVEFQFDPVSSRIGQKSVIGNEVEIKIMAGSRSNIDKTWSAVVLQGDTDKPLAGGKIRILSVDENVVVGRVTLTAQQVEANLRVRLSPPPKSGR